MATCTFPTSPTGLTERDEIAGGWLPAGRRTPVGGSAGCGKTMPREGEQIIAAPTVIKILPLSLGRFVGERWQSECSLPGLGLREASV